MIESAVVLPPQWLAKGDDGLRDFQRKIRDLSTSPTFGLLLHAPTGAGKTFALRLWLEENFLKASARDRRGLLIVSPTNALATEIFDSLRHALPPDANVLLWTAQSVRDRHGNSHRHQSLGADLQNAACIVTNPDTVHRFVSHAYDWRTPTERPANLRAAHSFLATIGLVTIDEYHAYDEPILASLLLFAKHMEKQATPPKLLLMSATPDESVPVLLSRLGLADQFEHHDEIAAEQGNDEARIRHEITLVVTNRPIEDYLPNAMPEEKTIFVFDAFRDILKAVRRLPTSIPRSGSDFVTVTGRNTNLQRNGTTIGQAPWNGARLIIATSKIDVGLNISQIRRFHMQPGWRLQQAWQRFGRAGRDSPCHVTLHLPNLSDAALQGFFPLTSWASVENLLKSTLPHYHQNVHRTQEWMARHLAFYHAQTRPQHAHRLVNIDDISTDHPLALQIFGQTRAILTAALPPPMTGRHPRAWDERRWQSAVHDSLKQLRGQRLQVDARYEGFHADDETTPEDLAFLLRWADHSRIHEDGRQVFVVHGIHDRPQDVELHYPLFGDQQFPIIVSGRRDHRDRWTTFTRALASFQGVPQHSKFRQSLAAWLAAVGPDIIRPLEALHDDAFV